MIDLHLHTTASDGRLSPTALVELAAATGLRVISVTDHDTVAGLAEAGQVAAPLGLRLIPGIEITAIERGRDVHILGYFFDPGDQALAALLESQRAARIDRVHQIAARLGELGFPLDADALLAGVPRDGRSVGRPLVADALIAAGHAVDRSDAFDRLLATGRPAFVPRCGPSPADVVAMISKAGGIASLAHPGLTAVDDRIAGYVEAGLHAIEARHREHDAVAEARYREIAARLNLAVSGGSDYHGEGTAFGTVMLPPEDFEALELRHRGLHPSNRPA